MLSFVFGVSFIYGASKDQQEKYPGVNWYDIFDGYDVMLRSMVTGKSIGAVWIGDYEEELKKEFDIISKDIQNYFNFHTVDNKEYVIVGFDLTIDGEGMPGFDDKRVFKVDGIDILFDEKRAIFWQQDTKIKSLVELYVESANVSFKILKENILN